MARALFNEGYAVRRTPLSERLLLTRGEAFVDQGQQRYEELQRERSIAALKRRAAALGFQLNPTTVTA